MLLGAASYDPAEAVSKATTALLAMTALDTENLRVKFKVPGNGKVLVRLKGQTHGATTFPRILLGVLQGAALKGRMAPTGTIYQETPTAASQMAQEAVFVVEGLTPGEELTWDAAYGVEVVSAATGLKYGGSNDNVGNDAFGAFSFEVWEAPTLLKGKLYDPLVAVTKPTNALLAMTALDTVNLRHKFKVPNSGKVLWRIKGQTHGATIIHGVYLLGILEGATVKGRAASMRGTSQTAVATACCPQEASGIVSGLTPGEELTWDAAYGVQVVTTIEEAFKYGGPNDVTTNNAFGGIAFEIWTA